jgi:Na+-translocating ferredoxin:NAD+ oxidoreductase RNF subunit RnfB
MTDMAEKKKGGLKELSPILIYKSLPKTNCKECGVDNCMAFATKIVNREVELDSCKPLLKPENAKSYAVLKEHPKTSSQRSHRWRWRQSKENRRQTCHVPPRIHLQEPNRNRN